MISRARRIALPPNAALLLAVLAIGCAVFMFSRMNAVSPGQQSVETGRVLALAGRLPEAERAWKEAVRLDPNNAAAWELLGELYMNTHNYEAAVEPLQKLAHLKPETPNVFAKLAECLDRTNRQDEALKQAREELKRNPNDVTALAIAAKVLTKMDDERTELEYKRRLVQLKPDHPDFLVMLARALAHNHLYAEAAPIVAKLIQVDPDNPEGYGLRGQITFYQTPTPEGLRLAEADFQQALQRSPQAVPPRLYLGRIYTRLKQPDKAIRYLTEATKLVPNRGDLFFALAEAYDVAGEKAKAETARNRFTELRQQFDLAQALEKRSALHPDDFDLYLRLGLLDLKRGEFDDADYYLHRALMLRPDDSRAKAALKQLADLAGAARTAQEQSSGPALPVPPGGP